MFVINYFFIHRSLWDWLQLLIVPAVLAGASVWFNSQQRAREQEIENQRAEEAAFQAYLDQMGQMLTSKEQPLHTAKPGDNLSAVARARTLSILRRLSGFGRFGRHKGSIVMFLYEARLITTKDAPIVNLGGADLNGLSMYMVGDDTGLKPGRYKGDAFSLREIDLSRCRLMNASFSGGDLSAANLSGALLWYAALDNCLLDRANLSDASMWEAQLFGANLPEANLSKADLDLADLRQADLTGADLTGADLTGADLTGADLRQATGWNEEQLEHAESLQDVTMPHGQKYEEWLKDKVERDEPLSDRQKADLEQYDEYLRNLKEASKEDRGEDGEKSSPSMR